MDFTDSPDERDFRLRIREWLVSNNPKLPAASTDEAYWATARKWHRDLYGGGFYGVRWPTVYGGLGLPATYELVIDEELAAAGAPPKPVDGYLADALLSHGTAEIKESFLPGLISGEVGWCQGFSEPDAGSDLASLRTAAQLDGDEYMLNGHKVWTSHSHDADLCIVLARTDPAAPKHRGISALIVDMHQPGVTQRPLRLMNGVSNEFGQITFENARVPASNIIGAPGEGWRVAMTVLNSERDPRSLGYFARYRKLVADLIATIGKDVDQPTPSQRSAIAWAFVQTEMLRVHVQRRLGQDLDANLGYGSIDKLLMTWVEQSVGHAALAAVRSAGVSDDPTWLSAYLYSRAQSVLGGTSEIQKNLVATRVLGL